MTQLNSFISFWVILFLTYSTNICFSQISDPQPKFIHYGIENGLPSSETYFVYQDSKGYMWFCTDRGVVRFDGYRYKIFTTKDGLFSDVVFKVYEDFKGRIWFLSMRNELCYLDNNKIEKYKYNYLINKLFSIYDTPTKDIFISKTNELYISFFNKGGYKIDNKGKYQKLAPSDKYQISFLNLDNTIFSITTIDKTKLGYQGTPIYIDNIKKDSLLWDIRFILSTKAFNNSYYIINNKIYANQFKKDLLKIPNTIIYCIKPIDKSTLILGTNNGAYIFKKIKGTYTKTNHFLKNNTITSIFKDRENSIWFSTLENGIQHSKNIKILNISTKEGLPKLYVSSINGLKNNIFIGINNYGWLSLLNPSIQEKTHLKITPKIGVFSNKIIISSNNLYQIKNDDISVILSNNWFRSIYPYENNIYLCARNLLRINSNNQIDTLYDGFYDTTKKQQLRLESILIDYKERILVGNINGLIEIKNKKASQENFKNHFFKYRITCLKSSKLFKNIAATRGAGIYFFQDTSIIDNITKDDGLLSNDVNSIYVDIKNRLWVCTNKGLNLIIKKKNGYLIEQFTTRNGLISNEINEVYEYENKVWCATKKGVSIIDLNLFRRSFLEKPILLEKVITKNKTIRESSFNIFPYNEEFVKILFRSLNYKNNQNPSFAYRTSKNSNWQFTKTPEIVFNLPSSNTYNIEVKSLNEDGKWSKPQLIYTFKIDVPFYYKWYSLLVFTLIIIGIMYLIFKIRINQINQKNNLNKKIKQLESKALRAQMNPHFIFNALNSIQSFLVYEENEKAEKYLIKFAYLIRQTLNNSRKSIVSIENEIDILNKYLELEEMRFKNRFTFNIANNLNEIDINLKIPPMMIQPYVENSILHAFKNINSGGLIHVTFEKIEKDKLTCIIEDNGIGISNSLKVNKSSHISLGTTITAERLSFFSRKKSNQFKIETYEETKWGNQGTKIIIEIPTFKSDEEL